MFTRMKLHVRILLILSLFVLPCTVLAAAGSVQVTVDKLNVRSGPSLNDPVLTTVTKNTVLPVISEQANWVKVKLPNGQEGWLASWMVKSIPTAAAQKKLTSKVTNLNIRSGPSQTFPVVANINPGQAYPVLQRSGEWVQIQLSGDKKGWAAGWLVTESGGTATTPVKEPVTAPTTPSQTPVQTPASAPALVTQQGGMVTVHHSPYIYPEPNSSLTAIGQLSPGMTVKQLSEQSGWINIDIDGVIGWISKTEKAPPPLTVTPQTPSQTTPPATSPSANENGIGKATVTSSMVNLRSQPTTDSELISTQSQGASLTLLEQQGDWYRVKTSEGNEGWVAGWLIKVEQAAIPTEAFVTILNPDTNVRSGPGTTYDIVSRVQAGERYAIVKKEDDWFRIKLKDGSTGYIAGWLVSADGTENVVKGNELVNKVIVVDAGHGGDDNGATGSSFSTLEKTINLQVSLLLKNKLEAAGAKVIMTRSDDRKLTLQDRVDVAINNNADIFVSIHHNTHPNSLTNGTIVFYYNQGKSSQLASLVQSEVVRSTSYKDLNARFGNYFVLRENPVVSILAEIGFLSNYQEELRLRSSKQQELAADGLYKGILRYFASQ